MLPSKTREDRNISTSSSSKSSSTSSSPSPFSLTNSSLISIVPTPTPKSMEEVWRDINLPSLPSSDVPAPRNMVAVGHNPTFRGLVLQDFLAARDPPVASVSDGPSAGGGPALSRSPAAPPPATVLSLNSGPEFRFLDGSDDALRPHSTTHLQTHRPISNGSFPFDGPFDVLASSSGMFPFGNKRFPETDGSSGDRRHKRMIKNRESAARSRARKQAYTNELEREVAHLMEENARLRRQQEQLYLAAATQLPKKPTLQRTSTAPF
ncbi:protein FD [Malania oleifera]|uniref:protein FD n=1 Tax=Malania oleifera TaxID=397392 RepID=UPI0025ADFE8F|nr:protein FD [Malania oleifera]